MGLIKQQLLKESNREKQDTHLIAKLNKALNDGKLTFKEWQDNGRFIQRDEFEKDNPTDNLHVDCTDVVSYIGGVYIQVLKSGEFYMNPAKSSKLLSDIEALLWEKTEPMLWGKDVDN